MVVFDIYFFRFVFIPEGVFKPWVSEMLFPQYGKLFPFMDGERHAMTDYRHEMTDERHTVTEERHEMKSHRHTVTGDRHAITKDHQ